MIVGSPSGGVEGAFSFVHEATPKAPAKAVSTAMRILRSFPKLKVVLACDMLNRGLPPTPPEGGVTQVRGRTLLEVNSLD